MCRRMIRVSSFRYLDLRMEADYSCIAPEPKPKKNRELKTEILPVGVPSGGQTPANHMSSAAGLPAVGTPTTEVTPTIEDPSG
jgi:hypothetical protein